MALSGAIILKIEVGSSVVAPSASDARTTNIDAPTNTKNAAWHGNRGTYGPNIAGPGITQSSAAYFAY